MAMTHTETTFTIPKETEKALNRGAEAVLMLSVRENPNCQGDKLRDLIKMFLKKCKLSALSPSQPLTIQNARLLVVIVDSLQQHNYRIIHGASADDATRRAWANGLGDSYITDNAKFMWEALAPDIQDAPLAGSAESMLKQLNHLGREQGVLFVRWDALSAEIAHSLNLTSLEQHISTFAEQVCNDFKASQSSSPIDSSTASSSTGLSLPEKTNKARSATPRIQSYNGFSDEIRGRAQEYVSKHNIPPELLSECIRDSILLQVEEYSKMAAFYAVRKDGQYMVFYPGKMLRFDFSDEESVKMQFLPGVTVKFKRWEQVNCMPAKALEYAKSSASSTSHSPLSGSPSSSSLESGGSDSSDGEMSVARSIPAKRHQRRDSDSYSSSTDNSPVGSPPHAPRPMPPKSKSGILTPDSVGSDEETQHSISIVLTEDASTNLNRVVIGGNPKSGLTITLDYTGLVRGPGAFSLFKAPAADITSSTIPTPSIQKPACK